MIFDRKIKINLTKFNSVYIFYFPEYRLDLYKKFNEIKVNIHKYFIPYNKFVTKGTFF